MWTHIQPDKGAHLTSSSIHRRARVGLSQALQLSDVVVLLGSGGSLPLGYPSWNELASIFVTITSQRYTSVRKRTSSEAGEGAEVVAAELRQLCEADHNGNGFRLTPERAGSLGDAVSVMGLCEELLEHLGTDPDDGRTHLHHARLEFVELFRAAGPVMLMERLQILLDLRITNGNLDEHHRKARSQPVDPNTLPKDWFSLLAECLHRRMTDEKGVEKLFLRFRDAYPSHFSEASRKIHKNPAEWAVPRNEQSKNDRNVIQALIEDLEIRRFLTLNYDVEIERELRRLTRQRLPESAKPFETLCQPEPTKREDPKRVTIEDGARRIAVSATLDSDSIGELVGFAALHESHERQVFHLHGRIDDPDNIVLTQRDYMRVYMRDGHARSEFEEVQQVLFGGNPILFVGTGVSEADVLEPFRRFVSRGSTARDVRQTVFALMPSEHRDDKNFEDRLKAIKRAADYHVHTIYYGGPRYRATMKSINRLVTVIKGTTDLARNSAFNNAIIGVQNLVEANHSDEGCLGLIDEVEWRTVRRYCNSAKRRHASFANGKPERKLLLGLVRELQGMVQSRALVRELRDIRKMQGEWWDEWRRPPGERKMRPSEVRLSEKKGPYLWVRHCPHEAPDCTDFDSFLGWAQLRAAANAWRKPSPIGKLRPKPTNLGRRVLRITMHRGGGAGAFIRQIIPHSRHSLLFAESPACKHAVHYEAAFIAHLSYSMEFSSVIGALTQFLARRVAVLQVKELKKSKAHSVVVQNKKESDAYIAARMEEPRLVDYPYLATRDGLTTEERRTHRLDVLKAVLKKYRALAVSDQERVFICLSGLDLLCDKLGDAHNPAFRAFFRLLTGDGIPSQELINAPLDIVLISGQPDVPICYLSEEITPQNLKDIRAEEEKLLSRLSRTNRVLVRWTPIGPLPWMERIALLTSGEAALKAVERFLRFVDRKQSVDLSDRVRMASHTPDQGEFETRDRYGRGYRTIHGAVERIARLRRLPEQRFETRILLHFLVWATQVERRSHQHVTASHPQRSLLRLLWDNLALSNWVGELWLEKAKVIDSKWGWDPSVNEKQRGETERQWLEDLVKKLDRAAMGSRGFEGVLEAVLEEYRVMDASTEFDPATFVLEASIDPELNDLLLQHLGLFALPIEPAVILDCPMVLARVDALSKNVQEDRAIALKNYMNGATAADDAQREKMTRLRLRRSRRQIRLTVLKTHLDRLVQRKLVMRIAPAVTGGKRTRRGTDFIHSRFALHARLRELVAHRMDLSLRDRGDRNHFQVTLYFDQPRDLPTPALRHYEMIKGIMDAQIAAYRKALRPAYAFSQIGALWRERRWDELPQGDSKILLDRDNAASELVTMLYQPADETNKIDVGCYDTHAVAMRLRGSFSLLRGTFSLASISRLDSFSELLGAVTPFDTYSGWLRSLLNAAVGVDVNRGDMNKALTGDLFLTENEEPGKGGRIRTSMPKSENGMDPPTTNRPRPSAEDLRKEEKRRRDGKTCIDNASEKYGNVVEKPGSSPCPMELTPQRTAYKQVRNPFYRDEVAWLYNECGLTALTQGRILQAIPFLERARFVITHQRTTPESDSHAYHATDRRILLNLSVALIEGGRLSEARDVLERLTRSSAHVDRSTPSQTATFASAYLALCDHMAGSIERAERAYVEVISMFNDRRQLRPVSIFNRHLGELYRLRRNFDKALVCADLAVTAASQAEQKDIQQLARVSRAQILLASGEQAGIGGALNDALDYAREMNLYRLQADALIVRAQLRILRGETDRAGIAAAEAIRLSLEGGLRLRKLGALHLHAKAARIRGAEALANRVLIETKREAEQIGYQTLAARVAEDLAGTSTAPLTR
ncbi:MAG: SIR2 family protein [Pseudomonadota bacterium]